MFNKEDAIFSIVFYLKENGWSEQLEDQYKAVFAYNPSKAYVKAIFKYAEAITN